MDLDYLLLLQEFRDATNGVMNNFFEYLSLIVIKPWFYILTAGIYWCLSKKFGIYLLFNMIGSHLVNILMKNTFCIYRPWIRNPAIIPVGDSMATANGYSFPSGHTTMAASSFGTVGVWFRKYKWVLILCYIIVFLVMFSRNYLGVHTPQDVIVGFLMTSLCMYINWKVLKWAECGKNNDLIILGAGTLLTVLFLLFMNLKSYPMDLKADGTLISDPMKSMRSCFGTSGMLLGLLCGWAAERRWVKFTVDGPIWERAVRFLCGAGIMAAMHSLLKSPLIELMGTNAGRFTWQFVVVITGVLVWPAVFMFFRRRFMTKSIASETQPALENGSSAKLEAGLKDAVVPESDVKKPVESAS